MLNNKEIKYFHKIKNKMSLEQLESAVNIIMGKIESIKRGNQWKENLTKHNNDFRKDWRIQAIQKANSNKKVNKKTLKELKEYRQSFSKS